MWPCAPHGLEILLQVEPDVLRALDATEQVRTAQSVRGTLGEPVLGGVRADLIDDHAAAAHRLCGRQ